MFSTSKTFFRRPASGGATDPSFAYVPLLLNTTSTNGQQNNTFLDSGTANGGVGFTITRNGTPTQGSITPYWPNGQWSNYFNGSTDYLSAAGSLTINGQFSVECWFYKPSTASTPTGSLFAFNSNNSAYASIRIDIDGGAIDRNISLLLSTSGGGWNIGTNHALAYLKNTWNQLVVTRDASNAVRLFINGVLINTPSSLSGALYSASTTHAIGCNHLPVGPQGFFNGYISNLRLINGSIPTLYQTSSTTAGTTIFTPPTSPLSQVTNTFILTCQSNRFIDNSASPLTLTPAGTPTVQAFQPFSPTASYTTALYGGSGYFNGSTDSLSAASNAAFGFGTGDYTIEGWVYLPNSATGSTQELVDIRPTAGASPIAIGVNPTGFPFAYNGTTYISSIAASSSAWNHIAVVRNGSGTNNCKIYVNGVQGVQFTDTNNYGTANPCVIGKNVTGSSDYLNGYASNVRLVKGTAVYTANFTPPTLAPLTTAGSTSAASYPSTTNVNTSFAASNTSLLLNFTNAGIYDAAVQNNAITVGNAQVSTAQSKWSPTSIRFNGTTDYLNIPSSQGLNLGTGSLTVEAWVYLIAMSGDYFVTSSTGAGGGFFGFRSGTDIGYGRTGIAWDYQAASGMVINNWYHVAWSRNGTSMRIFVNGSQVGATQTTSQAYDLSTTSTAVGSAGATLFLNGYIQDLRITRGIGRYTANFSVPTAAFPTR